MHFLDIFICKDAASSLELTRALPGSSRDNWLMHTRGSPEKGGNRNKARGKLLFNKQVLFSTCEKKQDTMYLNI